MLRRRVRLKLVWLILILLYAVIHATSIAEKDEDIVKTNEHTTVRPTTSLNVPDAVPTWRPKRDNCTPPAIEQFPQPLMDQSARSHGGLILFIIACIYSFIGLAIICDEYFVTSLDRICEELKLSPDVAGATFMAAGSSAPELATVVIGVFFAKDDIGISGVIGSAVFNIMFVISICGLFTTTVLYLNWWPLCRDCAAYAISILIMLFVIFDETITWKESLFMLIVYVAYCIALAFNPVMERWAMTLKLPCNTGQIIPQGPGASRAMLDTVSSTTGAQRLNEEQNLVSYKSLEEKSNTDYNTMGETSPINDQQQSTSDLPNGIQQTTTSYQRASPPKLKPLVKPETDNKLELASWYLTFPIHYAARATMPDLTEEKYRNWYPFTFLLSMIWISFYSYIMVWMITVIGSTLHIPDTVMGLTFVAAGVSVPDALSSYAVVKEGYGDMAVSNAVGSNVFDILVCLGLPWFLQTGIILPGSQVSVYSKGLTYSTISLLSTVLFLIVATHVNGWKLDRRYGAILMVWYILFIVLASLYELNVFGRLNPLQCESDY